MIVLIAIREYLLHEFIEIKKVTTKYLKESSKKTPIE